MVYRTRPRTAPYHGHRLTLENVRNLEHSHAQIRQCRPPYPLSLHPNTPSISTSPNYSRYNVSPVWVWCSCLAELGPRAKPAPAGDKLPAVRSMDAGESNISFHFKELRFHLPVKAWLCGAEENLMARVPENHRSFPRRNATRGPRARLGLSMKPELHGSGRRSCQLHLPAVKNLY